MWLQGWGDENKKDYLDKGENVIKRNFALQRPFLDYSKSFDAQNK